MVRGPRGAAGRRRSWLGRSLSRAVLFASIGTLASLTFAIASGERASESLAMLVAPYEQASPGPTAIVEDVVVRVGRLTMTLESGHAAPLVAGDRVVGLFFMGNATLKYVSSDPFERAVLTHNVKKTTRFDVELGDRATTIRGSFQQVVVLATPELLPDLGEPTPGLPSLDVDYRKHRKRFRHDQVTPISHLFAKQRVDRPEAAVLLAEIVDRGDSMRYLYDPIETRAETLSALRSVPFTLPHGARWPVTLSQCGIDRDEREFFNPLFLLRDLTYTVEENEKATGRFSVTETIQPLDRDQRVFRLDLDSEVFDNHGTPQPLTVDRILDDRGRDVPFHHARGSLVFALHETARAGEAFRVRFEYAGRILTRPSGNNYWFLGTFPWFPQPGLSGQYYTVHSTIKARKPFVPIAPGTTVSRRVEGDHNVVESRIDKPVQFTVAVAGKYKVEEEIAGERTIRVYSYAMPNKRAGAKLTNLAAKIIAYYDAVLGPFPFDEFNIIEVNELGWGQAPPGTMFITREAFSPGTNRLWSGGINHRFAHEIAHQYWGHVVKMGSWEEQWLTESFAEYCSSFVVRQVRGDKAYVDLLKDWQANASVAHESSSIAHANRLQLVTDKGRYDRVYLIYHKGALLLASLHEQIGDAAFASFLRTYQSSTAWRYGSSTHLPVLLEKITGEDYTPLFDDCFWGTKMPPKLKRLQ